MSHPAPTSYDGGGGGVCAYSMLQMQVGCFVWKSLVDFERSLVSLSMPKVR